MTVFPMILNQIELHLVEYRKENCHHDHTDDRNGIFPLILNQMDFHLVEY